MENKLRFESVITCRVKHMEIKKRRIDYLKKLNIL